MNAPRLEIDLEAIAHNARTLVERLAPLGISVTGITKASLGSPGVGAAMLRAGVTGLGDSRVENLARLRAGGLTTRTTLIRSPMLSQAALVVRNADISLNTEAAVIDSLAAASQSQGTKHAVVVMVELGDLREGVPVDDVVDLCRRIVKTKGVVLAGLGTNLACQSGVAPDQHKMDELSRLVEKVESACDRGMAIVSGGNSANLDWALSTTDAGRITDLRLGEAILLGTEPLNRRVLDGLRTDAFTLVAEVIELQTKPALPWGFSAQAAFGTPTARRDGELVRQAIVAVGRQDTDADGLTPPAGISVLGMSSDHLVLDVGDHDVSVGDELAFGLGYGALLRAATSPFVDESRAGRPSGLSRDQCRNVFGDRSARVLGIGTGRVGHEPAEDQPAQHGHPGHGRGHRSAGVPLGVAAAPEAGEELGRRRGAGQGGFGAGEDGVHERPPVRRPIGQQVEQLGHDLGSGRAMRREA